MPAWTVRRPKRREIPTVTSFLTGDFPAELRKPSGQWLTDQFLGGPFDPNWLWVAWDAGNRPKMAVYLHLDGCGGAVVLGYRAVDTHAEAMVWSHVSSELRTAGVRAVQVISSPDKWAKYVGLSANGFDGPFPLTEMQRIAGDTMAKPSSMIRLQAYAPADFDLIAATLVATYVGSLDSPELNDIRTPAQALQSHVSHANGEYLYHAKIDDEPVGVLILNPGPVGKNWDLTYLGIVPKFREQGHGKRLAIDALAIAAANGAPGITLTIDIRNEPARILYESVGFRPCGSYEVFLRLFKD
jgi:ribosomal protein S18 acetylase RimI-like enzyme